MGLGRGREGLPQPRAKQFQELGRPSGVFVEPHSSQRKSESGEAWMRQGTDGGLGWHQCSEPEVAGGAAGAHGKPKN